MSFISWRFLSKPMKWKPRCKPTFAMLDHRTSWFFCGRHIKTVQMPPLEFLGMQNRSSRNGNLDRGCISKLYLYMLIHVFEYKIYIYIYICVYVYVWQMSGMFLFLHHPTWGLSNDAFHLPLDIWGSIVSRRSRRAEVPKQFDPQQSWSAQE